MSGIEGLAKRLDALWSLMSQLSGDESSYTNEAVAERLRMQFDVETTAGNLSHLRSGRRSNPSAKLLWAISRLLDVPVEYFFDESLSEEIIVQRTSLLGELKEPGTRQVLRQIRDYAARDGSTMEQVLARLLDRDP